MKKKILLLKNKSEWIDDLRFHLISNDAINKVVNMNLVHKYNIIPLAQPGDFITCCETEDSLNPVLNPKKGAGWELGKVIKVHSAVGILNSYLIVDESHRTVVYVDSFRFSTDDEIKNLKK